MACRQPFQRTIQRRGEKGASALEVVVTMSVFLIVLFAVYSIYEVAQTTYARGATDIDLQDHGRKAQEELAGFVRQAGYDPKGAGIFGFKSPTGFTAVATEKKLLFSLDADQDGVLDNNSSERVGFALFGTELKRTMDGTNPVAGLPPIARNVQSIRFSYFNASDTPVPNPPGDTYILADMQKTAIRRITIQLTLSGAVTGQSPRTYTLSTDLRPRNL